MVGIRCVGPLADCGPIVLFPALSDSLVSPNVSRRAVLACGVAGVAGCLAGCDSDEAPPETITCHRDPPSTSPSGTRTNTDWPTHKFDPTNAGYAPDVHGPVDCPEIDWTVRTAAERPAAVAVRDDLVFVSGAADPNTVSAPPLVAFDAETGTERWAVDGRRGRGLTVTSDSIYRTLDIGGLQAVDRETRTATWTVDYNVQTVPRVVDGTVYAGGFLGEVVALDAATGERQWQRDLYPPDATGPCLCRRDDVQGALAVADDRVYATSYFGRCTALSAADGSTVWEYDTPDEITYAPTVADGTVYVADRQRLVALDAATGDERWIRELLDETEGHVRCSPTVTMDTVYVAAGADAGGGDYPQQIHAVGLDGESRWTAGTEHLWDDPVVADDTLYVPLSKGLSARDPATGAERWRLRTGPEDALGVPLQTPAIVDGTVFAVGNYGVEVPGYAYALRAP